MTKIEMLRRLHEQSKTDPRYALTPKDLALLQSHEKHQEVTPMRKSQVSFADVFGLDEAATEVRKAAPRIVGDEDEVVTDDEKERRGAASSRKLKVSFGSILGANHDVQEFPIESQPSRQPSGADTGEDALGRSFDDDVLARLGGGLTGQVGDDGSVLPAGAGPEWRGDTRNIDYNDQRRMPSGEGNRGRVGGEDRGVAPARPNLGRDGSYDERELGQAGDVAVRLGDGWVLNAIDPGIAPAAAPAFPDDSTRTLKRVRKSIQRGLFRSVIDERTNPSFGFEDKR